MLNQLDPNNSFWQDDELVGYVNDAISIYFLEIQAVNEGQFTTTVSLNIVANQELIALPSDFFKVKNLWKKVSDGYVELNYRNSVDQGYITSGGGDLSNFLPSYYFRENNLVLRNTPGFSEVGGILMEYIQFPAQLLWSSDALTNNIPAVFKELLVAYAVYKAKLKESLVNGVDVVSRAETHLATLYGQFKLNIAPRSKNPTFVRPFNPESEG